MTASVENQQSTHSAASQLIDPINAYIRLKAGRKGGKGNVLDRGWGRKDAGTWTRLDIAKTREHADRGGNLAVLTGKRSGHFTIDVDPKNGGLDTLAALEAEHGPLPATQKVRTPSGGFHLNYRLPADFEVGNDAAGKVFGPGIDVKGEFGYRVAPGSRTPAGAYTIDVEAGYEPCTEWLLDRLREHFQGRSAAERPSRRLREIEKVSVPPSCCEAAARRAVAKIAAKLDLLAELPEGKRLPLTLKGPEVGWDDGCWRLAARLVEIAQWRWSSVTLAEAEKIFFEHAPEAEGSFDPGHAWGQGLAHAGEWLKGDTHRIEKHGPSVLLDRDGQPMKSRAAASPGAVGEEHERSVGERFPVLGLDLLDPDRPPRRWFLDGVVPEGDHVSIVAPGGTGKSLWTLALSIAAVRGETVFIGRAISFPVGSKVLYVDKENSEEDWRERLLTFG